MRGHLLAVAARCPDKPAYVCGGGSLTYGVLAAQASALGAALSQRVRNGAPVLLWGQKQPEMVVGIWACLLAGIPYLPVDSTTPPLRLAHMIEEARPALALAVDALPQCGLARLGLDEIDGLCQSPATLPRPEPPADTPAYVLFTSGSSGLPKGVRVSRANLMSFARWLCGLPALAPAHGGTVLNTARFCFDLSVADMALAWVTGGTLYALEQGLDFAALYSRMAASGAAAAVMTPSFAAWCLLDTCFDAALLPGLKAVFFCGEALPPATVGTLFRRFPGLRVVNAYGPTEATVAVTAAEISPAMLAETCLPVGAPTGNGRVYVVGEDGGPLLEGWEGEILITGPGVGAYLSGGGGFTSVQGRPTYRTGDVGVVRDGLLYCLGRRDRQVKIAGHRIEPAEIERALRGCVGVTGCVVACRPAQGRLPARLTAYVAGCWNQEALQRRLQAALPAYMRPTQVLRVPYIPLTANGKADTKVLEELADGAKSTTAGGPGL